MPGDVSWTVKFEGLFHIMSTPERARLERGSEAKREERGGVGARWIHGVTSFIFGY